MRRAHSPPTFGVPGAGGAPDRVEEEESMLAAGCGPVTSSARANCARLEHGHTAAGRCRARRGEVEAGWRGCGFSGVVCGGGVGGGGGGGAGREGELTVVGRGRQRPPGGAYIIIIKKIKFLR